MCNTKESRIRVLVIEPYKEPYEKEIDNALEAKQELVGGLIECVHLSKDEDVILICNEEGLVMGLPFNRLILPNDAPDTWKMRPLTDHDTGIFGTFFLCGTNSEHFASLPPDKMEKYKKKFQKAHYLFQTEKGIVAVSSPAEPSRKEQNRPKNHQLYER